MSKMTVLIAGTAGYVLGARAGRQRYEQIRSAAVKVWGNPTVQSKVNVLEDKAGDVARNAARAAAGIAQEKAGSVADKVRHRSGGEASAEVPPETLAEQARIDLDQQHTTSTS